MKPAAAAAEFDDNEFALGSGDAGDVVVGSTDDFARDGASRDRVVDCFPMSRPTCHPEVSCVSVWVVFVFCGIRVLWCTCGEWVGELSEVKHSLTGYLGYWACAAEVRNYSCARLDACINLVGTWSGRT